MRYAEIKEGVVVNVVEADDSFATEHGLVPCLDYAGIGWKYESGTFVSPPPPPLSPEELAAKKAEESRRKLEDIDQRSIRWLREYLASRIDAPAELKALEAEAVAERTKLDGK